jgi:hypothetical protein
VQTRGVDHDNVIEALASDRADDAFRVSLDQAARALGAPREHVRVQPEEPKSFGNSTTFAAADLASRHVALFLPSSLPAAVPAAVLGQARPTDPLLLTGTPVRDAHTA